METLKHCWAQVTGAQLPAEIQVFVKAYDEHARNSEEDG
jgi:hypothetical protein